MDGLYEPVAAGNWQVSAGFAVRDEAEAAGILSAAVAAMQARATSGGLRPVLIVEDEMQRYYRNVGRDVAEPLPVSVGTGRAGRALLAAAGEHRLAECDADGSGDES